MSYRLRYCPRCKRKSTTVKPYMVRIAEPIQIGFQDCGPPPMGDHIDSELEEWKKYAPCGHVIPPEEHKGRIETQLNTLNRKNEN